MSWVNFPNCFPNYIFSTGSCWSFWLILCLVIIYSLWCCSCCSSCSWLSSGTTTVWSWTHWNCTLGSSSLVCSSLGLVICSTNSGSSLWRSFYSSTRLSWSNISISLISLIHPHWHILSPCLGWYVMSMTAFIHIAWHTQSSRFCSIFVTWHG